MTYKEFIQDIIDSRGQWSEEVYNSGLCNKHHITPSCLGGEGDYFSLYDNKWNFRKHSHHSNCIYLYPHEHYKAHELLYKENIHNSDLAYAWHFLHSLLEINSEEDEREYDLLYNNYVSLRSENTLDSFKYYWKGKSPDEETLIKRSKSLRGIKRTQEWKDKIGAANKGRVHSEKSRKNMSEAHKGIHYIRGWFKGKIIRCIELDKRYYSKDDLAKDFNRSAIGHIRDCCLGYRNTSAGYHWEVVDE